MFKYFFRTMCNWVVVIEKLNTFFLRCNSLPVKDIKVVVEVKSKTCHAHCSKLCLLKVVILVKKHHLGNFVQSNIEKDCNWATKNHFLSSTLCVSVKVSKFQNRPRPLFKTVSVQMHYFPWKSTFSNFSRLKYSQWK